MTHNPECESPAADPPRAAGPGLGFALGYGGVGFGLVSAIAYSLWAFRLVNGAAFLYASIAGVYIGVGGLVLSRLMRDAGARKTFPLWFALGFVIYAIGWCACWFGLKGKFQADFWGAVAGLASMTLLWQRLYGRPGDFWRLFAGLFALHSAGYYLGEALYATMHGPTGRLLWGAAHGVGFGAGIGYVLWRCQHSSKMRLPSTAPP